MGVGAWRRESFSAFNGGVSVLLPIVKDMETRFGLPCLFGKAADRLDCLGHQKNPNSGALRGCIFEGKEAIDDFLTWIVLGVLPGFNASNIVSKHGGGIVLDIVLRAVGAVVGGWLFALFEVPL